MCGRLSMADRTRRRTARLVLFHKIHDGLVTVNMPLDMKYNSGPTRTENSLAYHIPASSVDYQKNSFFFRAVRDWNCLPDDTVHTWLPEHFRDHILPWTVSEVLHQFWWKGVVTLPWGARDTHLYFNQHYSSALGHFCVTHSALATGQESSICSSLTILRRRRIIIKNIK